MTTHSPGLFRRLAAVAGLSVLGAMAAAAPAAAATAVFTDARGDMPHGADIQRVRVVNDGEVRVKVVHRNLVRSYKSGSSLSVFFDTDRRRTGPEFVLQGGTYEGSDYALLKADGWKAAGGQSMPLRCDYSMRLDYARDVAVVRVARPCLGNPGAIRVEVKTGGEIARPGEQPTTVVDWLGSPRRFTPWVERG